MHFVFLHQCLQYIYCACQAALKGELNERHYFTKCYYFQLLNANSISLASMMDSEWVDNRALCDASRVFTAEMIHQLSCNQ